MPSIAEKLANCRRHGTVTPLTSREGCVLDRAIDVLRRISEHDCTNAASEAADMIREIDAR